MSDPTSDAMFLRQVQKAQEKDAAFAALEAAARQSAPGASAYGARRNDPTHNTRRGIGRRGAEREHTMTTNRAIALAIVLGLSPLSLSPAVALAHHAPTEDSEQWSCVDDGNRICGPGNANGVPPGCYDDGGVMVAPWPCHVVVNADGSADAYYGAP